MAKRRKIAADDDVLASESVSRLKAAVRQSTRLLARDDIKLDLRQTTERRLEALESQLELAQSRKKQQKLAARYHGLRFIERKKILRKLNQVKKQLSNAGEDDAKRALNTSLAALRIDLHYIMSFPKDRKYVALFPNGEYVTTDTPTKEDETDKERAALRKSIRKRIKNGELDPEPELHLDSPAQVSQPPAKLQSKPTKRPAARGQATENEGLGSDDFFDV